MRLIRVMRFGLLFYCMLLSNLTLPLFPLVKSLRIKSNWWQHEQDYLSRSDEKIKKKSKWSSRNSRPLDSLEAGFSGSNRIYDYSCFGVCKLQGQRDLLCWKWSRVRVDEVHHNSEWLLLLRARTMNHSSFVVGMLICWYSGIRVSLITKLVHNKCFPSANKKHCREG